jgi:hypothetical protein
MVPATYSGLAASHLPGGAYLVPSKQLTLHQAGLNYGSDLISYSLFGAFWCPKSGRKLTEVARNR